MLSAAAPAPAEVFQTSLAISRSHARQVIQAVLGTILFHRVLGTTGATTVNVLGVAFPAATAPEIEQFVEAKAELMMRALASGNGSSGGGEGEARRAKLFLSLYPTPLPLPPPPHPSSSSSLPTSPLSPLSPTPSSTSTARPSSPCLPHSPSPTRGSIRRQVAQAAPAAVTSALGWFSASARAALIGGSEGSSAAHSGEEGEKEGGGGKGREEGQEEELRVLERVQREGKGPWEGWVVEVEVVPDRAEGGRKGEAEERTRSQLSDFLLRSLSFCLSHTTHVPPITTADLFPYGVLVLVDPPADRIPFAVPKRVEEGVGGFPGLHRVLVTAGGGGRAVPGIGGERRAASVGGRW
ncbi:hypothetical protein JCM8547_006105 [Rhodosporidiobolus lusitaniae]